MSKNLQPKIIFPNAIHELASTLELRKVVPFTSEMNGDTIASLLVTCKDGDLDFEEIASSGLQPMTRFRMYNLKSEHYGIEIELKFEKKCTFKLHLDPSKFLVKEFLNTAILSKRLGFHFKIKDHTTIINLYMDLDEEDIGWFERNYKESRSLDSNLGYEMLCNYLKKHKVNHKRETLFNFYDTHNVEFLIDRTTDVFLYSAK